MDDGEDGVRVAVAAGAGRPAVGSRAPTLTWEGLDYRVDWFAAEHARLKRIREQIESPGLDAALAADDAEKIADALLALIYTPALGDPEGPALLGGDIAQRHNFGLVGPAGMRRDFVAWALPKEQVGDGTPWHVEGSILGLDIALARLALRRIADNEMPVGADDQPERSADVRAHGDDDQSARRSATRIAIASSPRSRADASASRRPARICRRCWRSSNEAQLPPSVRQTLPWTITRTPDAVPALFGLRDLLWLGKPELPQETLDHWGVYAESLDSRLKTAMPHAGAVGQLRRPRRRRPDRDAGAGPRPAAGGGDGPAETPGATRPRPADVRGPGLLARRRIPVPGRLAGDDATGTGAFAVAGRRLRGGAGRRRPLAAAVAGCLLHFYGWRNVGDGASDPCCNLCELSAFFSY